MKKIMITILIVLTWISLFSTGFSRSDGKNKISLRKPDIVDLIFVNYNNWSYVMRNNGSYMYDSPDQDGNGNNAGGEFPRGSGVTIVYAGGFYIGTLKDGIPVVSETEFATEFQPGRIINSGVPFGQLKVEDPLLPSQKVYLIDKDNPRNWPEEALRDQFGNPALIADAQTWAIFNDINTSLNQESLSESPNPGLGIEVALESYSFNGPLIGDVVYTRYILTNKTNLDYTQTYFGMYSDSDVDNSSNDIVGTDTTRSIEYVYNNENEAPFDRAVGFDIMQGPVVNSLEIPARDLLRNQNNKTIQKYDPEHNCFLPEILIGNQIVLGAVSTNMFEGGTDPINNNERYNVLRGANRSTGTMKSNCGLDDYFIFRGNPITEQGTCDVAGYNNPMGGLYAVGFDLRTLISTGPFTIKAGESQEIWVGIVGAKGVDRLDAVANLFATDDLAQTFFDAGFPAPLPPEIPNFNISALDKRVILTWQNNAEVSEDPSGELLGISTDNGFSADYVKHDFQGYRVYRSLTGLAGSFEMLAQFDKVDTLGLLSYRFLNSNFNLEIREMNFGNNTGLRYTFTDSNLTNGQNYFYSVTAYDAQPYIAGPDSMLFDGQYILKPAGIPVSLESPVLSNAVSVVPFKSIASSAKNIKVVPNPFYKYSSFETNFDKMIKFTNLPEVCTIKIFTVAGDLIKTIKHNATSNNDRVNNRPYDEEYDPGASSTSIEQWDLKTSNGHYVASGMYIALIKSPAGKRFVKFAIIQ